MTITVGLDFGTHQTKVCISSETAGRSTHEFLEFIDDKGARTVLFPSVVQINTDDTLSYGFVDVARCKTQVNAGLEKPILVTPEAPPRMDLPEPRKPQLPPKPVIQKDWKDALKGLNGIPVPKDPKMKDWERTCKARTEKYEKEMREWNTTWDEHEQKYNRWQNECQELRVEHEANMAEWKKRVHERMNYTNIKIAYYSRNYNWMHQVEVDYLAIWYVAYVLYTVRDHLGGNDQFHVQVGVPSHLDTRELRRQVHQAHKLLVAARKLVELYPSLKEFVGETYDELMRNTDITYCPVQSDIEDYGIHVQPEAHAALMSISARGAITRGMSLVVDIGGGTTDIGFFTLRDDRPDIHAVISLPYGLNYISEPVFGFDSNKSMECNTRRLQDLFKREDGGGTRLREYHKDVKLAINDMINQVFGSFMAAQGRHGLDPGKLFDALWGRPVIYCGGGSMYEPLRMTLSTFRDVRHLNRRMIGLDTLLNKDLSEHLWPILATSYGLSIPQLDDEVRVTPVESVFDHIVTDGNKYVGGDYEHGLTNT